MWAWGYVAGWLVTMVLVCRWSWHALSADDREFTVVARGLTLAAGVTAGAVWPAWWAGVLARDLLWPTPDPDPLGAADEHDDLHRDGDGSYPHQ